MVVLVAHSLSPNAVATAAVALRWTTVGLLGSQHLSVELEAASKYHYLMNTTSFWHLQHLHGVRSRRYLVEGENHHVLCMSLLLFS